MEPRAHDRDEPWWRGAIGYQIYVRSFQDTDGDGIGDLAGVRRRLPYLADLGVDLVWLTPFYPSPQADHGYDVADYLDVDPTFGDLDEVDRLIAAAHDLGLRVVFDLVPNHTSSEHPWFQAALAGDERYRDYYVWRDPAPGGGPPNNWVAHFGGPAWTLDEASGQYYMHLFLPEQPDLDWRNPAVRDEFDRILEFWFARGVDGLRVDVAHSLIEDAEYRDNPYVDGPPPPDADPRQVFNAFQHVRDLDQPEVLDIYRRWNAIAEDHGAVLIGEVYLLDPSKLTRYVDTQDGLHSAFCFATLHTGWDVDDIRRTLTEAVAAGAGALSWPLSSHDDPHAASRFGGGSVGARRQLAYWTLLTALPGTPFLYQGDELGLSDGAISVSADPLATRNEGAVGRDGSRTPMVWEPGPGYGFTDGEPWLPFGDNRTDADTATVQDAQPGSHLDRVRRLHRTRRELDALTGSATVAWLDTPDEVIGLRRDDVCCVMNTAPAAITVALPRGAWRVRFVSSDEEVPEQVDGTVDVPSDTTLLLQAVGG